MDRYFLEGVDARRQGSPETVNPYDTYRQARPHDAWLAGWRSEDAVCKVEVELAA